MLAKGFDLDAIWPLDDEATSKQLSTATGFFWRSYGDSGPFDEPEDALPSSLLSPDWALSENGSGPFVHAEWEDDDPLRSLFSIWFGFYQNAGGLSSHFRQKASQHRIRIEERIPSGVINFHTPIAATQLGIKYSGHDDRSGVMNVDVGDPRSLLEFWNLRASGANVFPWVKGQEYRLSPLLKDWYSRTIRLTPDRSQVGRSKVMSLWNMSLQPQEFDSLNDREHCEWQAEESSLYLGWMGHNALNTPFTRTSSVQFDPTERKASIPLPPGPPSRYAANSNVGIVAAQVSIYTESGLRPGVVATVPNLRKYSRSLDTMANYLGSFERVVHEGRAVGVAADAHDVEIGFTTSIHLFDQLFADSAWRVKHTEGGRLASRIIDMLGGVENYPGNQPAIRRVLDDAAKSTSGRRIPTLIQAARNHQGEWPRQSFRTAENYPKETVYGLLHRKLLQPFLELKCPHCSTKTNVRPEALAGEIECEICSDRYPLGLALGVAPGGKNEWVYRLTGNLSADRISEIMPVAATQSVLTDILGAGKGSIPHVYGVTAAEGKWSCEIDVVALADGNEGPRVVLGEVKSYRDPIDRNDLNNLVRVQKFLESTGVTCLILAATLKEKFSDTEVADLRSVCESSEAEGGQLPIVLTGTQLSVPRFHPDYPASWDSRFRIANLARESCQRNLGLVNSSSSRGITWATDWEQ